MIYDAKSQCSILFSLANETVQGKAKDYGRRYAKAFKLISIQKFHRQLK